MNNLQLAIIYSSIIGSILAEFEQSKKPIEELKRQIKKFMFKRSRTNAKEFEEAIKKGNEVWVKAVNHFADKNITIDSFGAIVALWSGQDKLLERMVNLSEKRIEKFSMLNDNDKLDAELNSYDVAKYINNEIKSIG